MNIGWSPPTLKMSIKFFYDFMSQPARTLYIFFKLNKIPFEGCPVALRKGEHMTDEFKEKYNRFGKVPFIHDGDFKLAESVAIVRYISRKYNIDNNWYPKDSKKQARVDEYLEWQHHNTRLHNSLLFLDKLIKPQFIGKEPSVEKLLRLENELNICTDFFESTLLTPGPYVCGNEISVADIFAASEFEQGMVAGFNPTLNRPKLAEWLKKVRNETNPYYDEAHATLKKFKQKYDEKIKAKL